MIFEKSNPSDDTAILRNWCACPNCDGKSAPHSDYNVRSGPENPKQNS